MARLDRTRDEQRAPSSARQGPIPGVVALFSEAPLAPPLPLRDGVLELGRGMPLGAFEDDDCVSRAHVRLVWDGAGWSICDLGSRNGTYVNGQRLEGALRFEGRPLLRIGRSLLLCVPDMTPYLEAAYQARQPLHPPPERAAGPVLGAFLRRAFAEIEFAARSSSSLLINGESGSGKELAARVFHDAHEPAPGAPFVALNCAAIPEGLAERLLFGAKRGAYSGAVADSEGYVAAAHGGTLFLDEIAELDAAVQAKLLRVLETREVLALGSTRPQRVEIRVCAATHKDLRAEVEAGRFRQDLYFRIGRPAVVIPPLRERIDEIPAFAQRVLAQVDARLSPATGLIEACALREWPGNVRELLQEMRRAAHRALHAEHFVVGAEHLPEDAGQPLARSEPASKSAAAKSPSDHEIEAALAAHQGNVTRAARDLGMHRNQLRRWLAKRSVEN